MRIFTSRPVLRWLVPAAFLLVVAGIGLVVGQANANPKLPAKTAEQLLVAMQQAKVDGLSGTVVQEASLGIPEIAGSGGSRSSDFNSLVSGSHTLRVWYSGSDKARVALLGTLGESDVITNGSDMWTWSSDDNTATHRTIRPDDPQRAKQQRPDNMPKTPQEAAQRVLTAIGPTTLVSTDSDVTVAHRQAYELVLRPKVAGSLISSVRIAVDGQTFVPLRVRLFGTDEAKPAMSVGFESVDFNRPPARQFSFNPPPRAKVTEVKPPTKAQIDEAKAKAKDAKKQASEDGKVIGKGWTAVWVGTLDRTTTTGRPGQPGEKAQGDQLQALLRKLPHESGSWGSGRVLRGTAFSLVITDDGRVALGAVQAKVLFEALTR